MEEGELKPLKVILSQFGQSLGVSRDCFTIKQNKKLVEKIPFWKTNEIVIASKNSVSVDSLLWASLYNVDVTFTMHNGKPLAFLHSIKNQGKVETRLNQLRAYDSRKGLEIAKAILLQKIENENNLLKHLNLQPYELNKKVLQPSEIAKIKGERMNQYLRFKLNHIEEDYSLWFYRQIFKLFPRWLRITNRTKRNAIEPLNNLLNLSFEVLQWKVMKAIVKSKLEPCLGFLHAEAWGKPSLVCDLAEPFRPYVVHFLLEYCKTLEPEDFKRAFVKNKVPRYFLKHEATWNLIENLNKNLFEAYIPQQINRKVGFKMQFETLIDEYTSNLARSLNSSTLKIAETTFPQPLPYNQKQWTTSTSSSSLGLVQNLEKPNSGCSFLASHKNRRKTPYCHAENA